MKLLLFLLRLLFFFLGAPTNLWRHLGGIQANDQWKIRIFNSHSFQNRSFFSAAEFVIENVNPDRILIDFRNEKIEIPVFSLTKKITVLKHFGQTKHTQTVHFKR